METNYYAAFSCRKNLQGIFGGIVEPAQSAVVVNKRMHTRVPAFTPQSTSRDPQVADTERQTKTQGVRTKTSILPLDQIPRAAPEGADTIHSP